jgi:hypothetical protein
MSDETTGLIAGLLAVVAALIVYSMIRAAAQGHLTKDSGFGIISPAVKKTDATWTAGHEAAVPVARKTIVATAVVWVIVLVIGLVIGEDWTGYLGLVPYAVIVVGFVPMVQAANAAAREAAKKSPKKKRKKK